MIAKGKISAENRENTAKGKEKRESALKGYCQLHLSAIKPSIISALKSFLSNSEPTVNQHKNLGHILPKYHD